MKFPEKKTWDRRLSFEERKKDAKERDSSSERKERHHVTKATEGENL